MRCRAYRCGLEAPLYLRAGRRVWRCKLIGFPAYQGSDWRHLDTTVDRAVAWPNHGSIGRPFSMGFSSRRAPPGGQIVMAIARGRREKSPWSQYPNGRMPNARHDGLRAARPRRGRPPPRSWGPSPPSTCTTARFMAPVPVGGGLRDGYGAAQARKPVGTGLRRNQGRQGRQKKEEESVDRPPVERSKALHLTPKSSRYGSKSG